MHSRLPVSSRTLVDKTADRISLIANRTFKKSSLTISIFRFGLVWFHQFPNKFVWSVWSVEFSGATPQVHRCVDINTSRKKKTSIKKLEFDLK